MRTSGNGNLAALALAFVIALIGPGLVHQSNAKPPSVGGAPTMAAPPPTLVPPARAKPAPVTPPFKPGSNSNPNSAGKIGGPSSGPTLPSYRAPLANCRAACATSCNNSTPCAELSVTQCTSARQRCRLQCSSSC
jgi:hypothetical protein